MREVDVLVIGAGAAGLSCAARLKNAGSHVVVLEARDRIGGRIHTIHSAHGVVEAGAEFIHGDMVCTWSIIRSGHIETVHWKPVTAPRRSFFKGGNERPDSEQLQAEIMTLEDALYDYSVNEEISVDDFYARHTNNKDVLYFSKRRTAALEGAEAKSVSVTGLLADESRANITGNGNFFVSRGYDQVSHALAEGLDIRLNTRVSAIEWGDEGGVVHTEDGESYRARHIVLTVPLGVLKSRSITFTPELPTEFVIAIDAVGFGNNTKLAVILEPETEIPNYTSIHDDGAFGTYWFRRFGPHPTIIGFSGGDSADILTRSRNDAVELGYESVRRLCGGVLASRICAVQHYTWLDDPFARGSYSYPSLHEGEARNVLAKPISQALIYAGEVTNMHGNPATVHGAIESGYDAAHTVLSYA